MMLVRSMLVLIVVRKERDERRENYIQELSALSAILRVKLP